MSDWITSLPWLLPVFALSVMTAGGLAYYLLAIFCVTRAIARRNSRQTDNQTALPPISLIKPLCGEEPGLEQFIESFFRQDYPEFEVLFAVRNDSDPAVRVVRRLEQRYPHIRATLILTGEPAWPNAKVLSMEMMAQAARYDVLVITDSDTSVERDYLRQVAAEFADPRTGAMTSLYRGVPGSDWWSRLEAIGMSTEFMAGVVVAERLEGMKFTLGPSMAVRRECLDEIGGFARMKDYLADDFVLGNWADAAGWNVRLSLDAVNHHATNTGFLRAFKHRLRWNRSSRYSRPSGYFGQGFTYGISWAVLLAVLAMTQWAVALLIVVLLVRITLAILLGRVLLRDRRVTGDLWLMPLQDFISFASWVGGLHGRIVVWRGESYRLLSDGRFEPVRERTHSPLDQKA